MQATLPPIAAFESTFQFPNRLPEIIAHQLRSSAWWLQWGNHLIKAGDVDEGDDCLRHAAKLQRNALAMAAHGRLLSLQDLG